LRGVPARAGTPPSSPQRAGREPDDGDRDADHDRGDRADRGDGQEQDVVEKLMDRGPAR
jgi:hypothetical protein